jgi:hypothetical protein
MSDFIEKISSELEDQKVEVVIYRITCYPADYTLQVLWEKWKNKEIIIPLFQRKYVWTLSQASKLIESFLIGLPVPGIFFYKERKTQKSLVIDGQQRLRSIFAFFEGVFPDSDKKFCLRDVNPKWMGMGFSDLDDSDKRRLNDSVLRAVIVDQTDPKDHTSIYHIFERLNTGGTPLKLQEVRNCVYQGEFNSLLKDLNKNSDFREIIGSTKPDKRMRDIELILRFLALLKEYEHYKKPMKDFLSEFMDRNRDATLHLKTFEETFEKTVSAVYEKLGPNPFRMKAGLNAAVFDSVMIAFASNLSRIPADIKRRHKRLLRDNKYIQLVSKSTTDEKVVKKRIKIAREKLFS